MRQEYSYKVEKLGLGESSILNEKDKELVQSYNIGIQSFNPDESRLDVIISDLDETVLETYIDSNDYTVRGVMQGPTRVNQLEVDPTIYFENRTFPNNSIIVEYKAFNNVYGKGSELYLVDISSDRTEVRLKSTTVSPRDLQNYTLLLQNRFDNSSYFSEAFLEVQGVQVPIINALTEVTSQGLVVTFKLYEELPENVTLKDLCQILESLGESYKYRVSRKVVVVDDPVPELKGPNFAVEVGTTTVATDYKNYRDLLSQKSWESSKELYTAFRQAAFHTSVDYSDFSDFVHFSSAAERLENARYKFETIFECQAEIAKRNGVGVEKYEKDIEGIIENFDHYENYLYFEYGPYAWPKKIDPETNLPIRPYVNVDHILDIPLDEGKVDKGYGEWYEEMFEKAEAYDVNNKDILISTIPAAIREDLDHNEPYLIFIHMIGQHFDDLWIYARAITDRYKGDNRPDFGISKELVKETIEHFGIDLYESNQNLNALFELCQPDGTYDSGLENYVNKFRSVRCPYTRSNSIDESGSFVTGSWEEDEDAGYEFNSDIPQPILAENYTKEVYKRIYHNIPVLLKTRGTSRGLRVLLNCFGIPNDILTFKVQGGVDTAIRPFFGPEESITISPQFEKEEVEACCPSESLEYSGSIDKIRLVDTAPVTEYVQSRPEAETGSVYGTGSFYTSNTLSRYTTVTGSSEHRLTDDLHKVEIGFDINEGVNKFFRENVGDFTVDTVLGDPRNRLEDYGDPWRTLRESLLAGLDVDERFRAPAAVIRLVRYFDTTLFRMLQEFVPARASISHGAIVKDNILHRNRWKGVDVSWKLILETGSISGSTIEGSHGGAYKPDYDTTTGSNVVSTGGSWVDKPVPSGSREFNGELAGTVLEVTDGELNDENPDKKAGQPRNRYGINVWFLDLPDIPLCSTKVSSNKLAQYWEAAVTGILSASVEISSSFSASVEIKPGEILHVYTPIDSTGNKFIVPSRWQSDSYLPNTNIPTFFGWNCAGLATNSLSRSLDLDVHAEEPEGYSWIAEYREGIRKILWFTASVPHDDTGYYYSPGDLLVAWKYLNEGDNPETAHTYGSASAVWASPNDVWLRIEGDVTASRFIPAIEVFGTNNAYFWAGLADCENGKFGGVERVGDHEGPFEVAGVILDAQWFRNRGEWPTPSWFIDSSSAIPTGSRSQEGQPWY